MSFEQDINNIENTYGPEGLVQFYKAMPQRLAEGVADYPGQGPLMDADEAILVRNFPENVIDCPDKLLDFVQDAWATTRQPVTIEAVQSPHDTVDKCSRIISVLDRLREHFGENWQHVTVSFGFNEQEEVPFGWLIRPRDVEEVSVATLAD